MVHLYNTPPHYKELVWEKYMINHETETFVETTVRQSQYASHVQNNALPRGRPIRAVSAMAKRVGFAWICSIASFTVLPAG